MCRRGPRTFADEGQSGAVNDEVQAGARAGAPKREGEMLTASRERGVIGGREIDAQHPEDRGQDALGLTQRSVEDETERQGGFDGEIGILEVPAPPADASRCPRGDRVRREPEGDVASPHEGSVVLGPVPDAIRCLVLRMHSRLHIEIMTRRRSRWSTCRPPLAHRAESAHQRRSDASAHRIISDLSAFIGHSNPTKHRILTAGDLNMFYGATGSRLSLPERERTVWDRMQALGLEFLGPQAPHGRSADSAPDDVSSDTKNVPTFYRPGGDLPGVFPTT